ncbi:hypothetical protein [Rhodococcus erythropolis]|uniref:hypothetical protein n=1 Tax=Rhodococcus erythropolis TaxID=1833 RepID=UPI0024B80D56|nr:hypothetical protein [Rhodococcus erythropolis]MDJ0015480.1 hypothetical protein [Rhodococcus erythropolis]
MAGHRGRPPARCPLRRSGRIGEPRGRLEDAAGVTRGCLLDHFPSHDRLLIAAVHTWPGPDNLKIKSVEVLRNSDSFVVADEDVDKPALVVEALRGGELVGAITINRNRHIIEYTRALSAEEFVRRAGESLNRHHNPGQLDCITEFDPSDPSRGGWTIAG